MATVIISAGQAGRYGQSSGVNTMHAVPRATQTLTSSASNQVSTVILYGLETVAIFAAGGAIKVAVAEGANPDATSVAHYGVGDGATMHLTALAADTRIAIVDA